MTVREPRLVRKGTQESAEDGLGAVLSISRQCRVRPLKRFEVTFVTNQGGTTVKIYRPCFF